MWKIVEGFRNYEINENCQVRNSKSLKILSQSLSSKGYYQVNIGRKSRRVHRLLALAFIPNPLNLETVNHIDGNKLNNKLDNLEWMSRPDNVIHSRNILGLVPIPYSKSSKSHHLIGRTGNNSTRGKKIKATFSDGSEQIFGSAYDAALQLFNNREFGKHIRQSIKRQTNSYKNIKFSEYEPNNQP